VHTIGGEGKRDKRICVALPIRRYTRRRPGKGNGGGGSDDTHHPLGPRGHVAGDRGLGGVLDDKAGAGEADGKDED
jgi:hypothetical protein